MNYLSHYSLSHVVRLKIIRFVALYFYWAPLKKSLSKSKEGNKGARSETPSKVVSCLSGP